MKKRYFVAFAVIASILLTAVSCRNKVPVTPQPLTEDVVAYDNSEYVMMRNVIEAVGKGSATSRQRAKDLSFVNIRKTVEDVIVATVKQVASNRHFSVKEPIEFTLPALRGVKYDYTSDKGVYEFSCRAEVPLQEVTKELYACIKAPQGYGYYQFLRDMDLVLGLNQFKNDFNTIIKE